MPWVVKCVLEKPSRGEAMKLEKKLKMIELQLKKAQLDLKTNEKQEQIDNTPVGEGKALDRNEILRALSSKGKE